MKRNIISDTNEIQLFMYTKQFSYVLTAKKKNEKNWIEPIELKLLCWIFYLSP
jgi:hypothetical protein